MSEQLGRVLLIVNPAAQNGRAGQVAQAAAEALRAALGDAAVEVRETQRPRHAVELACASDGFDTVLALGGDGLIHEVANGLMRRPEPQRPLFGIVPVGSGNDYAASLGMSKNARKAVAQLLVADARRVDVGCCNGEHYVETVSFGLDAAIALDTMERRRRTGRTGTVLYFAAGIDQLMNHLVCRPYRMTLDDGRCLHGESYIFAVQNGRTYGGGFKVCPEARMDDGVLDICIAHPPLSPLAATGIFTLAKEGFHTGFKQLEFLRTKSLHLEFEEPLPAQIDGELLRGTSFNISVERAALRVLAPSGHSFGGRGERGGAREAREAGCSYVRVGE